MTTRGGRRSSLRRAVLDALEERRLFAFSLTTTASTYTVDTGAGVVFSVLRQGSSSTIHSGDLTSFKLNGVEFSAPYSSTSRYSHFESGLGNASVISAQVDPSPTPQWIKITCDDTLATNPSGTGVIQYYIAKKNDPNIYMATYAPVMIVSSTRFITYLDWNKFPNHPDESDTSGSTGGIETADVQGFADGTTASKYYGETRNIDHLYHGATGPSSGAFMFIGDRESGAGGPFWKDIDFQSTGAAVEVYNMPFSGHSLTDTFRPGLHGPYALSLTNGSAPSTLPNYTFLDGVGLQGWVSPSGRGTLSGRATGVAAGQIPTVGLNNTAAQYWATPDASGNYTISGIKPGTYTETLYSEELAVGTRTVTITAGQTTRADITATAYFGLNPSNGAFTGFTSTPTPIWRIGTWDGTPREFLNGDKITIMHPTDVRMSPWADSTGMTNFTVGTDPDSAFPMAEWHTQTGTGPFYADTQNRITFNLSAAQAATAMTLRIGITRLDHGRPNISVNGGSSPTAQNLTSQPDTRGLTLGNWRANNSVYSFNISTSSLHAGSNYLDIWCASGSTGTLYSGYHIYDALELVPTSSITNAPVVSTITVTPANSSVPINGNQIFVATAKDQFGNVTPANVVWSATSGLIDDTGAYIAPANPGTDTITATVGSIVGSTNISVLGAIPIVAATASASPNPAYNNTTTLSVLGADDGGEAALTYTWNVVGTPPSPVNFSVNGTNAAKSSVATFSKPGTYTFLVTIADTNGNSVTSQTSVTAINEKVWYRANETTGATTLADASGNSNNATLTGANSFVAGTRGNYLQLSGGNATLPTGIVSGLNDFTVAAWVKVDAQTNWTRLFDFGTGTTSYMFLAPCAGGTNAMRFAITTSGNGGEQTLNGPAFVTGAWTHVAVTLSGNLATLYVNGVSVATNANMTIHPAALGTTTQNYLGKSQFASDPAFVGGIDEFRLYGRALSSTEVGRLADTTAPQVSSKMFNYEASQSLSFNFSEDVLDSLSASDFTITNLTTASVIPANEFTLVTQGGSGVPTIATLTHNIAAGVLPDGNYRATIAGVNDVAGNPLATSTFDFFILGADANRDRKVDTSDFNTLAANFGGSSKVFSQGNFNYDAAGAVDSTDFGVFVSQYGQTLPAPSSPVTSPPLFAVGSGFDDSDGLSPEPDLTA